LNQQIAILESPHITLLPFEPYLLEQLERTAESPWPTG
jgi:hypothetical protein